MNWLDPERFAAIRQQLDEKNERWAERIAATVEEDYRQLVEDRGNSQGRPCSLFP